MTTIKKYSGKVKGGVGPNATDETRKIEYYAFEFFGTWRQWKVVRRDFLSDRSIPFPKIELTID